MSHFYNIRDMYVYTFYNDVRNIFTLMAHIKFDSRLTILV